GGVTFFPGHSLATGYRRRALDVPVASTRPGESVEKPGLPITPLRKLDLLVNFSRAAALPISSPEGNGPLREEGLAML
ncbi:MAG: hypothetical protein ACRDHV_12010, partial [Actinomycetota bacterium]